MVNSMTGFAARKGEVPPFAWAWELRSVNARGLDIRTRNPDWIPGLEQEIRAAISAAVGRGSVALTLRVQRDETSIPVTLNKTRLEGVLQILKTIEARALVDDLHLAPTTAAEILAIKGIEETTPDDIDTKPLAAALLADLRQLLAEFNDMRASEGAALKKLLLGQLSEIEGLIGKAASAAELRSESMARKLRENLARVLDNADMVEPDRVAQELALIAVKTDVREELDRLQAHVQAARDLLETTGPIGRKLDFLSQEFNREANTLCSKAQSTELTRIGLDLKALIEQMREQVQNVE